MRNENGNKQVMWWMMGIIGTLFIGSITLSVNYVYSQMGVLSVVDTHLREIGKNNAIKIATLEECARETKDKLARMETKIDLLVTRNFRVDDENVQHPRDP